jgi:hypothetical protein
MISFFRKRFMLSIYFIFFFATFARAFGNLGHYVIGQVAHSLLNDDVKGNIDACGYLNDFNNSMGTASIYPDIIKRRPEHSWTRQLHYYDIENDPPEFCGRMVFPPANSSNLMSGLEMLLENLEGKCSSKLFFALYIHLIEDMHQPLHLTGKDRGGNERWFEKDGKKWNLHRFWDWQILLLRLADVLDHKDFTCGEAVDYFSTKAKNQKMQCASLQTKTDHLSYYLKSAAWSLRWNCKWVWRLDHPQYMEISKILVEDLIMKGIETLYCALTSLYTSSENVL